MKRVIFVDGDTNFVANVKNSIIIDDLDTRIEVVAAVKTTEELESTYKKYNDGSLEICVHAKKLNLREKWDYEGVLVTSYGTGGKDKDIISQYPDIPTYGVVGTDEGLAQAIYDGAAKKVESGNRENQVKEEKKADDKPSPAKAPDTPQAGKARNSRGQTERKQAAQVEEDIYSEDEEDVYKRPETPGKQNQPQDAAADRHEQRRPPREDFENQSDLDVWEMDEGATQKKNGKPGSTGAWRDEERKLREEEERREREEQGKLRYKEEMAEALQKQDRARMEEIRQRRADDDSRMQVERDLRPRDTQTKVVVFHSAKGGVGKTTIACAAAQYLANIYKTRDIPYRVALVDYNIDFGDVRNLISLSEPGVDPMTFWAAEIRDKIKDGVDPRDIEYSREEIDKILIRDSKTPLLVLPAPIWHADSMYLGEDDLTIMLRNIVKYGEFDFVIIDTGNNTRDSSIIGMDMADYIFTIVTQDFSALFSNISFLETMKQSEAFNMNKVSIIINDIRPASETGCSVADVESALKKKPVAARIRHHADVIKANNQQQPLTLNAKHPYQQDMMPLIQLITGVRSMDEVREAPKKNGLFSRIFGKKR